MAFLIMIWILIAITTIGLALSIAMTRKYLSHHNLENKHFFVVKRSLTMYMGMITIVTAVTWWITLILFEINIQENIIDNMAIDIMLVAVPAITVIVYLTFFGLQKYIENYFDFSQNEKKSFFAIKCMTFMTSLIYAMMVNYGIQLFIMFNQ
jgi:hypothetical protein